MTLEEYLKRIRSREKMLNKYSTIRYHKDVKIEKDEDIKKFIFQIALKNRSTYWDKTEKHQCRGDAYRSTYDIYRICKYYRGDISLEDVLFYLIELYKEDKLATRFCCTVMKRIWKNNSFSADGRFDSSYVVDDSKEMQLSFAQYKQYYLLRKEAEDANKGKNTRNRAAVK